MFNCFIHNWYSRDSMCPACQTITITTGTDTKNKTDETGAKLDVKYDSDKVDADAISYIEKFRQKFKDAAEEMLGEIYVNCLPHIQTDAWINYREALRLELEHEYMYSKFRQPWAKNFRRAVFVENRDEISGLISADILARNKELEDRHQDFEMFRYSPGGDRYQDKVKQYDELLEQANKLEEALDRFVVKVEHEYCGCNSCRGGKVLTQFAEWKGKNK